MNNLLKETKEVLEAHGYTMKNIRAVLGTEDSLRISVEHFERLADVEYNAGYGSPKVAEDLCLVMDDGSWFTRGEYDGSEWWAYHNLTAVPETISDDKIVRLTVGPGQIGGESLASCNGLKED